MPDITTSRGGWDFFEPQPTPNGWLAGETIEKEDDGSSQPDGLSGPFSDDLEAENHVLFRTLALLEEFVAAALEIDGQGQDAEGHKVEAILFARRVLAAVARRMPAVAALSANSASSAGEGNCFLERLLASYRHAGGVGRPSAPP